MDHVGFLSCNENDWMSFYKAPTLIPCMVCGISTYDHFRARSKMLKSWQVDTGPTAGSGSLLSGQGKFKILQTPVLRPDLSGPEAKSPGKILLDLLPEDKILHISSDSQMPFTSGSVKMFATLLAYPDGQLGTVHG